ncbi:hypothetical protein B0H13DRAFT_2581668 [Mycena leptocephala]|nr:hypothetical protein B0H13DRAFT_2581668 [Mycena leptocephala]
MQVGESETIFVGPCFWLERALRVELERRSESNKSSTKRKAQVLEWFTVDFRHGVWQGRSGPPGPVAFPFPSINRLRVLTLVLSPGDFELAGHPGGNRLYSFATAGLATWILTAPLAARRSTKPEGYPTSWKIGEAGAPRLRAFAPELLFGTRIGDASFIVFRRVLTVADDAERKVWDSYEREGEDLPSARPHLYSPSFFYFTLVDANPFRKRRRASVIVGGFRRVRDWGVEGGSDFDFIFASLDLGGPDRAARGVGCATHPPFLRVSRTGERKEAGGGGDEGEFLPAGGSGAMRPGGRGRYDAVRGTVGLHAGTGTARGGYTVCRTRAIRFVERWISNIEKVGSLPHRDPHMLPAGILSIRPTRCAGRMLNVRVGGCPRAGGGCICDGGVRGPPWRLKGPYESTRGDVAMRSDPVPLRWTEGGGCDDACGDARTRCIVHHKACRRWCRKPRRNVGMDVAVTIRGHWTPTWRRYARGPLSVLPALRCTCAELEVRRVCDVDESAGGGARMGALNVRELGACGGTRGVLFSPCSWRFAGHRRWVSGDRLLTHASGQQRARAMGTALAKLTFDQALDMNLLYDKIPVAYFFAPESDRYLGSADERFGGRNPSLAGQKCTQSPWSTFVSTAL